MQIDNQQVYTGEQYNHVGIGVWHEQHMILMDWSVIQSNTFECNGSLESDNRIKRKYNGEYKSSKH